MQMVIVLIQWKIKPNLVEIFKDWWLNETIPASSGGLFGEFLSNPIPKSEFNYKVNDLIPDSGDYVPFVNVGIWESELRFQEVVGHLFNDDAPKKEFEFSRRERTLLNPFAEHRGTWQL